MNEKKNMLDKKKASFAARRTPLNFAGTLIKIALYYFMLLFRFRVIITNNLNVKPNACTLHRIKRKPNAGIVRFRQNSKRLKNVSLPTVQIDFKRREKACISKYT